MKEEEPSKCSTCAGMQLLPEMQCQRKEGVGKKYSDLLLFPLSDCLPFLPLYQTQLQANKQGSPEYAVSRNKPHRTERRARKNRNWVRVVEGGD